MYDVFFLTFKDDRRGGYVRIEAPTRESAQAYVAHTYEYDAYDELLSDVLFNPQNYPWGELDAVRVLR